MENENTTIEQKDIPKKLPYRKYIFAEYILLLSLTVVFVFILFFINSS